MRPLSVSFRVIPILVLFCLQNATGETILHSRSDFVTPEVQRTVIAFDFAAAGVGNCAGGPMIEQGQATIDDEWADCGLLISDSSPTNGASAGSSTYGIYPHSGANAISDSELSSVGGHIRFDFIDPVTHLPTSVLEAGLWIQNGDLPELVTFIGEGYTIIASTSPTPYLGDHFIGCRASEGIVAITVYGDGFYLVDDLEFGGSASGNQPPIIQQNDPLSMVIWANTTCPGMYNEFQLDAIDPEGYQAALTWSVTTPPEAGTVSFKNDIHEGGSVIMCFEPAPDQCTSDTFIVEVEDLDGATSDITINVDIVIDPDERADLHRDGVLDGRDVVAFVATLLDQTSATPVELCRADIGSVSDPCTADGQVTVDDIEGFIHLLLGTGCEAPNIPPVISQGSNLAMGVPYLSSCPNPGGPNELSLNATDQDGEDSALSWSQITSTPPTLGTITFLSGETGNEISLCYEPWEDAQAEETDQVLIQVEDEEGGTDVIAIEITIEDDSPE